MTAVCASICRMATDGGVIYKSPALRQRREAHVGKYALDHSAAIAVLIPSPFRGGARIGSAVDRPADDDMIGAGEKASSTSIVRFLIIDGPLSTGRMPGTTISSLSPSSRRSRSPPGRRKPRRRSRWPARAGPRQTSAGISV